MISSLLHLVGLRPRVYYTLTNFRGGGGQGPLGPPQYANAFVFIFNDAFTYYVEFTPIITCITHEVLGDIYTQPTKVSIK